MKTHASDIATACALGGTIACLLAGSCLADEPEPKYEATWESLDGYPVPAWFEDAKFGIFIHWGAYSVMGYRKGGRGYSEHVPKMLYSDPEHYYPWMKERFGAHPPKFGYKDIVAQFKAENWDPQQWAKLFEDAGAKYVVLTAEHHDGYALWDSELTDWCATKVGPKRDLVGELGVAVRERGLKYAPSYHRERHTGFFAKDLYAIESEPRKDIAEEIRRVPSAAQLYGPFDYDQAFIQDYVARWQEIQRKYEPDFMWIDDIPIFYKAASHPRTERFRQACATMIADYLNDAGKRGQAVYLNNKGKTPNWPADLGCLEKDNLKMSNIGPKWENPATLGTSYGYMQSEEEQDRYKSPTELIHLLCDVVSKNGNLLLNIGPRADGTIPAGMQRRLLAIGAWLKVNGESIYGATYWDVFGEHKGEVVASDGGIQDKHRMPIHEQEYRFTAKSGAVYVIAFQQVTGPIVLRSFANFDKDIKSVSLLGSESLVSWNLNSTGLQLTPSWGHSHQPKCVSTRFFG